MHRRVVGVLANGVEPNPKAVVEVSRCRGRGGPAAITGYTLVDIDVRLCCRRIERALRVSWTEDLAMGIRVILVVAWVMAGVASVAVGRRDDTFDRIRRSNSDRGLDKDSRNWA